MGKRWCKCVDCFPSAFAQFLVVAKLRQSQKIDCGNRACGRLSAVIIVFHSQHNAFVFAARREVAAVFLVGKQTVLRFLKLKGKLQPLDVEGSFVKIEKSLNDKRVIVGKAFDLTSTVAIIAKEQFALVVVKLCAQEFRRACRSFDVTRLIQNRGSARAGRNHQAVPCGNDFIVQMWARTFVADRQQLLATACEQLSSFVLVLLKMLRRLGNRVALTQNILATEFILRIASFRRVTVRLDTVVKLEYCGVGTEGVVDLFFHPNIKRALAVLRLSVFEKAVRVLR